MNKMFTNRPVDIANFFVAGINYKKTDAAKRGEFAIDHTQYENILKLAPSFQLNSLFILSTCNRTEIYGFADNVDQLAALLCTQTTGSEEDFNRLAYIKKGASAAEHLFNVGAGLDSQILGDYEIIGQLKQTVKFSKERGFINCFIERLVNGVLQTSKNIKNNTALSDGTVSVSFAAVQYIRENVEINPGSKILVVGIGKIGRNTCKNLVDYLGTTNITLINRTEEKAVELANELNLQCAAIDDLADYVGSSDIILVSTNAGTPLILKSHLENTRAKLIIDLSVPSNVETSAGMLPYIKLVNVDELSKLKDDALLKREAEAPKARRIIENNLADFMDWYKMRKNAFVLNAIKTSLNELHIKHQLQSGYGQSHCPVINAAEKIQRVINGVAHKMRIQNQGGCLYIEAINEFFL